MSLPFDSSDEHVRFFLHFIRLQILTPTAILINIAANVICAVVIKPNQREILNSFRTPLSFSYHMFSLYWLLIFTGLVGYCFILLIAHKEETRKTIVEGVGIRFVVVNWLMAIEAVTFAMEWFIATAVIEGINILLLFWIHLSLIYHPPSSSRPLDALFIHTPLRLFLASLFLLELPNLIFITLGWIYPVPGHPERNLGLKEWEAAGFIAVTNVIALVEVAAARDIVWTVAGMWAMLTLLLKRPKPGPVFASTLTFVILYPVVLITVYIISLIRRRRVTIEEGRIALPINSNASASGAEGDDEEVERIRRQFARPQPQKPGYSRQTEDVETAIGDGS